MFEQECFGHARRVGQLARGRAVKPLFSKDAPYGAQDGGPPLFAR